MVLYIQCQQDDFEFCNDNSSDLCTISAFGNDKQSKTKRCYICNIFLLVYTLLKLPEVVSPYVTLTMKDSSDYQYSHYTVETGKTIDI